jgi:hypothetical protein
LSTESILGSISTSTVHYKQAKASRGNHRASTILCTSYSPNSSGERNGLRGQYCWSSSASSAISWRLAEDALSPPLVRDVSSINSLTCVRTHSNTI